MSRPKSPDEKFLEKFEMLFSSSEPLNEIPNFDISQCNFSKSLDLILEHENNMVTYYKPFLRQPFTEEIKSFNKMLDVIVEVKRFSTDFIMNFIENIGKIKKEFAKVFHFSVLNEVNSYYIMDKHVPIKLKNLLVETSKLFCSFNKKKQFNSILHGSILLLNENCSILQHSIVSNIKIAFELKRKSLFIENLNKFCIARVKIMENQINEFYKILNKLEVDDDVKINVMFMINKTKNLLFSDRKKTPMNLFIMDISEKEINECNDVDGFANFLNLLLEIIKNVNKRVVITTNDYPIYGNVVKKAKFMEKTNYILSKFKTEDDYNFKTNTFNSGSEAIVSLTTFFYTYFS